MSEFIIWIVCILGYGFMGGLTFITIAKKTSDPDDPFQTPGPTFGALFWLLSLPAMLGAVTARALGNTSRVSRAEKRRALELSEAKHKKELARLDAEALAIHEKALKIT